MQSDFGWFGGTRLTDLFRFSRSFFQWRHGSRPPSRVSLLEPETRLLLHAHGLTLSLRNLYFHLGPFLPPLSLSLHPVFTNSGTGVKLLCTLLHELERSGKRYGLEAICEGGCFSRGRVLDL